MENNLTFEKIAKMIDHAMLKPETTRDEVEKGCVMALKYNIASVCVKGCDISMCASILKASSVKVCGVVGFPHGSSSSRVKLYEAQEALSQGANELDMVLNIARVKQADYSYIVNEIKDVLCLCRGSGVLLKLIFENCLLERDEIISLCKIASHTGVDFVKTSTGFSVCGARTEDVALMRDYTKDTIGIKAAGGIKTLEDVIKFYNAGASRIGTSSTEKIMEQAKRIYV